MGSSAGAAPGSIRRQLRDAPRAVGPERRLVPFFGAARFFGAFARAEDLVVAELFLPAEVFFRPAVVFLRAGVLFFGAARFAADRFAPVPRDAERFAGSPVRASYDALPH